MLTPSTYGYDEVGNRTRSGETTTAYDAANQVAGWQYDAAGNLLNDGTTSSTYDALNRLVGVASSGSTTSYTYNGDGVLLAQVQNGVETRFVADVARALPERVGAVTGTAVTWYVRGLDGEELYRNANGSVAWFLSDRLGSVRAKYDAAGRRTARYEYTPYGAPVGSTPQDYGYTGEPHDATTGLVYLRARWYDPGRGMFTSRDPFPGLIINPHSLHPYSYAADNPINFTDPSGRYLESFLDIAFIGYDLLAIGMDIYHLTQASGCEKEAVYRQLAIDASALALDVGFLLLPGATGGGPALRLAMAGGDMSAAAVHARQAAQAIGRTTQTLVKPGQIGGQVWMASQGEGGRRSPEFHGGQVSEETFLRKAENYLGPGYQEIPPGNGRFVSADGMRQVRYGRHETSGQKHHAHFEAYDRPYFQGGKVVENTVVEIIP